MSSDTRSTPQNLGSAPNKSKDELEDDKPKPETSESESKPEPDLVWFLRYYDTKYHPQQPNPNGRLIGSRLCYSKSKSRIKDFGSGAFLVLVLQNPGCVISKPTPDSMLIRGSQWHAILEIKQESSLDIDADTNIRIEDGHSWLFSEDQVAENEHEGSGPDVKREDSVNTETAVKLQ